MPDSVRAVSSHTGLHFLNENFQECSTTPSPSSSFMQSRLLTGANKFHCKQKIHLQIWSLTNHMFEHLSWNCEQMEWIQGVAYRRRNKKLHIDVRLQRSSTDCTCDTFWQVSLNEYKFISSFTVYDHHWPSFPHIFELLVLHSSHQ